MYYLYKAGQFLALTLPLAVSYVIATVIAFIYYLSVPNDRRALQDNLRVVLGEGATPRTLRIYTRRTFINFAKYLADFFRTEKVSREERLRQVAVENQHFIDEALRLGKGVIMLSSHIGNWEMGATVLAALGYPVHALVLDHAEERVNAFFVQQRSIGGVRVLSSSSALRSCIRVLRNNAMLAILGDRDFSENGRRIAFFGRETLMPKGPAYFALKTGAPIVWASLLRERNDRFRLVMDKPIYSQPTGNKDHDIDAIMRSYLEMMEGYIRRYPDQWYVFRKVWD